MLKGDNMSDKAVRKIEVKAAKKVRKFSMPIYMNIILLALGIALLIWADKVTSLISIIIGATFIVLAAYNLIAYLRVENRDMKEMPRMNFAYLKKTRIARSRAMPRPRKIFMLLSCLDNLYFSIRRPHP